MNPLANFFSTLFASRTQSHVYHLGAIGIGSFAAHLALQAYYEGIIPIVDPLIESIQGKSGLITGWSNVGELRDFSSTEEALKYFQALYLYVEQYRSQLPQDTYVQNQVDTIVELINSTIYKLKFLK